MESSSTDSVIKPGSVAWYVAAQFYVLPSGEAFDVGYFTGIAGLSGPFFRGDVTPEAGSAFLTFSAQDDPFTGTAFTVGKTDVTRFPTGTWKLYYQESPEANFKIPETFARGLHVATFRRPIPTLSIKIGGQGNSVLSFEREWSQPFIMNGKTIDLAKLIPHGVTQYGYTDEQNLAETGDPWTAVVAAVGSAVAF